MDWVQELLKLLFGQLGSLGTVCVAAAAYSAWLHYSEREDHKKTREMVARDAEQRLVAYNKHVQVLAEIKTLLCTLGDRRNGSR